MKLLWDIWFVAWVGAVVVSAFWSAVHFFGDLLF
jgi:hypothetical protein